MGQALVNRHGGARLKYNLFVQPTEPATKDGLWIKTPSQKGFKDIVCKKDFLIAGTLAGNESTEFKVGDKYRLTGGYSKCYESKYLYFLGWAASSNSGYYKATVCRYNVFTDTEEVVYTGSRDYGVNGYYHTTTTVAFMDGKMYVIDSGSSSVSAFPLYDMEHNQPLDESEYYHYQISASDNSSGFAGVAPFYSAVARKIFTFSYASYDTCPNFDIYDIQTKTSTIDAHPFSSNWILNKIGQDITSRDLNPTIDNVFEYNEKLHILSCDTSIHYVYDYATKAWSQYQKTPFPVVNDSSSGGHSLLKTLLVGSKVYCLFSPSLLSNNWGTLTTSSIYIYYLDTDTFEKYMDIPIQGFAITAAAYVPDHGIFMQSLGMSHYAGGGTGITNYPNMQLAFNSESQPEQTLCIQNGAQYPFRLLGIQKLYNNLPNYTNVPISQAGYQYHPDFSLSDAWIVESNEFQKYPTYIGDGTQWTKIKN